MKTALLGLALSIAAVSLPAEAAGAQQFVSGPSAPSGPFIQTPTFGDSCLGRVDRGRREGDRHRGGFRCSTSVVMDYYGGEWALYNNRSWDEDSYNDWWHDNPQRAYPAWMRRNQHCDRMWWSGDTLVC